MSETLPNQNGVVVDWCDARATSAVKTKLKAIREVLQTEPVRFSERSASGF